MEETEAEVVVAAEAATIGTIGVVLVATTEADLVMTTEVTRVETADLVLVMVQMVGQVTASQWLHLHSRLRCLQPSMATRYQDSSNSTLLRTTRSMATTTSTLSPRNSIRHGQITRLSRVRQHQHTSHSKATINSSLHTQLQVRIQVRMVNSHTTRSRPLSKPQHTLTLSSSMHTVSNSSTLEDTKPQQLRLSQVLPTLPTLAHTCSSSSVARSLHHSSTVVETSPRLANVRANEWSDCPLSRTALAYGELRRCSKKARACMAFTSDAKAMYSRLCTV